MPNTYSQNLSYGDLLSNVSDINKKYIKSPTKSPKSVDISQYQNLGNSLSTPQNMPKNLSQLGSITTPFGESTNYEKFHPGIDIANKIGTAIPSFSGGTVAEVRTGQRQDPTKPSYGNYVVIVDPQGNKLRYSHLYQTYVKVGQRVNPGVEIGTMGNCFDKETEVLTNNGWKLFKDVKKEDLVMTTNIKTRELEYQKPTVYIDKIYDKMYGFKNKNIIDFVVSGDHRMLIQLHQEQKLKFVTLGELPNRSYVRQTGFKWKGKEKKYFILPSTIKGVNQTKITINMPSIKILMDDWLEFLGWWLSDGWVVNTKKSSKMLGITQSFNNGHKREIIKKILSKLPFSFYEANEDFRLNNIQVYEYLKIIGAKGNKSIPDYIFNLSPRQIKLFLDAYHLGDGWFHKGTKYYVFGEKKLADQVQELILKIGGGGHIVEIDPKNIKRKKIPEINGQKVIATQLYWVLTETRINYASILKKEIEEIDYNNHAYCLTVPNSTLYVRRNGKTMFCGNSGSTYSNTGGTGSHLDFRIKNAYGKYVNPFSYLKSYNG